MITRHSVASAVRRPNVRPSAGQRFGAVLAAAAAALLVLLQMAASPATAASPDPLPSPAVVNGTRVPWHDVASDGTVRLHLYFGWTSTCPHCAKARPFIAGLVRDLPWLTVHNYQLDGDENAASVRFIDALGSRVGEPFRGVPIFLFDGTGYTGFDDETTTGKALREAFVAAHDRAVAALGGAVSAAPAAPAATPGVAPITLPFAGTVEVGSLSLPLVTVVLASLDAVNPCALSVLLFLLSLLVGTKSRRRMVGIGGTFVLVSGLTYFVFMAAWLNVFLLTGGLRVVTLIAGAAALVAALINIKDFAWFRRGVSLTMPESAKPRIFGRMIDFTARTQFSALFAGTILVAVAANAYEAICTGGFPVVFTRILTLHNLPVAEYYGWLLLYNLVYVAPLFAIVLVFARTLGSHTVTIVEARRLKLLSGLLMLGMAVLLLVAPDQLGDFGTSIGLFCVAAFVWLAAVLLDRHRARLLPPLAIRPHDATIATSAPPRAATPLPATNRQHRPRVQPRTPAHGTRGSHGR